MVASLVAGVGSGFGVMVLIEPFSSVITSQARQLVAGMEVVVVVIPVAVVC